MFGIYPKSNVKKRLGAFKSILLLMERALENHTDFVHPGIQLEQQELAKFFFKAIDLLPEQQRTAYVLHKLDQVSYNEIAGIMKKFHYHL